MADIKITADSFKKITSDQSENQEKISAPSLTFFQDAVRRLRKDKV
ncbi:ABC transporter permease, partial [Lactobacillus sp. XV13L]|nr:ABC transporter permease [Lactobacillus sp. XV13L]